MGGPPPPSRATYHQDSQQYDSIVDGGIKEGQNAVLLGGSLAFAEQDVANHFDEVEVKV